MGMGSVSMKLDYDGHYFKILNQVPSNFIELENIIKKYLKNNDLSSTYSLIFEDKEGKRHNIYSEDDYKNFKVMAQNGKLRKLAISVISTKLPTTIMKSTKI